MHTPNGSILPCVDLHIDYDLRSLETRPSPSSALTFEPYNPISAHARACDGAGSVASFFAGEEPGTICLRMR